MTTINDIGNDLVVIILGTDGQTKANEISEKFQTAFDPPPHFRKIILQFFQNS